jgi:copper(I)-binding protein
MSMSDAGTITLKDGENVSFAPGGLHVMVMEPSEGWKPGGIAKVTLVFSGGMTATVDVPVRAAGDER